MPNCEPALIPNQPNHKKKVPSTENIGFDLPTFEENVSTESRVRAHREHKVSTVECSDSTVTAQCENPTPNPNGSHIADESQDTVTLVEESPHCANSRARVPFPSAE